jgi:hypothetical protein
MHLQVDLGQGHEHGKTQRLLGRQEEAEVGRAIVAAVPGFSEGTGNLFAPLPVGFRKAAEVGVRRVHRRFPDMWEQVYNLLDLDKLQTYSPGGDPHQPEMSAKLAV